MEKCFSWILYIYYLDKISRRVGAYRGKKKSYDFKEVKFIFSCNHISLFPVIFLQGAAVVVFLFVCFFKYISKQYQLQYVCNSMKDIIFLTDFNAFLCFKTKKILNPSQLFLSHQNEKQR